MNEPQMTIEQMLAMAAQMEGPPAKLLLDLIKRVAALERWLQHVADTRVRMSVGGL